MIAKDEYGNEQVLPTCEKCGKPHWTNEACKTAKATAAKAAEDAAAKAEEPAA